LDEWGRPESTAPSFARSLGQSFAPRQMRIVDQVRSTNKFGEPVAMYDTGDPYILENGLLASDGEYDRSTSPGILGTPFGLRFVSAERQQATEQTRMRREAEQGKAAKNYERKLRRVGG